MGVHVTGDRADGKAALFDSSTGWAFGPVFESEEDAEDFLAFTEQAGHSDLRLISHATLARLFDDWEHAVTCICGHRDYVHSVIGYQEKTCTGSAFDWTGQTVLCDCKSFSPTPVDPDQDEAELEARRDYEGDVRL